ncbi:MAG: hypothetical protein ACRD9Q_09840, partial [Nitrososphaeraceae archaeon]
VLHINNTKAIGKANRIGIWFFENEVTPTWVILHELAHSMTSDINGNTNLHGKEFVGNYVRLVLKYLNVPLPVVLYSLDKFGIQYNFYAKPYILNN